MAATVHETHDTSFFELTFLAEFKKAYLKLESSEKTIHDELRNLIMERWATGIKSDGQMVTTFSLEVIDLNNKDLSSKTNTGTKLIYEIIDSLTDVGLRLVVNTSTALICHMNTLVFEKVPDLPKNSASKNFLAIRIQPPNEIIVLGAPSHELWNQLINCISKVWIHGITRQSLQTDQSMGYITLDGSPWKSHKLSHDIESARLTTLKIIDKLAEHNWSIIASMRPSSSNVDTSCLYFEYQPRQTSDIRDHFLLGLENVDTLYLVNANEECVSVVDKCIDDFWEKKYSLGVPIHKAACSSTVTYYLDNDPWFSTARKDIDSRYLLCHIFEAFHAIGWQAKANLNYCRNSFTVACFCLASVQAKETRYIAVTFVNEKLLRFVNCNETERDIIVEKLNKSNTICNCTTKEYKRCFQVTVGENFLSYPAIVSQLMKIARFLDWTFVVSAPVKKLYTNDLVMNRRMWSNAAHTLFFEKSLE